MCSHSNTWWGKRVNIGCVQTEFFDDREEAKLEEKAQIKKHQPTFNRHHTGVPLYELNPDVYPKDMMRESGKPKKRAQSASEGVSE